MGNAGTADDKGDVDVFFKATFFARAETVLADVETVVGGVDDVGVVENPGGFELLDDAFNELIYGLKGAETRAVEVVIVFNDGVIQLWECLNPGSAVIGLPKSIMSSVVRM